MARISTSTSDDLDWSGMAVSFSVRWSWQGEWTSTSGTAKTSRRGRLPTHRIALAREPAGRRPRTWSQRSIDCSKGSRCAGDQGSMAVVIRTRGIDVPSIAVSSASPSRADRDRLE